MEQNIQSGENSAEIKLDSEGEPIAPGSEEKINKKIILLIVIILIIIGFGMVYFLFSNKEDDDELPVEVNVDTLEDKKVEEDKIDKEFDTDLDGLPDYIEEILGTNFYETDTDGDTYSDFDEIKSGYNPLNDKKLTEEEWENLKNEIKNKNEGLYTKMFEDSVEEYIIFPDKLDLCEPFSYKFKHPFTGEMMERKIVGMVNDKCQYTEEMPNNGKMYCEYSEDMRKAIAQYHRDTTIAKSIGTSIEADLGSEEIKITYTIDGKEVENPLQEALDNKQCVISGYEDSEVNGS
ncbi:MAG: hypothetical protein KAI71_03780 [Candidatus Pacebacteria bacterium]|nr:hypothetical protein [Candidatus Paceibacterota bacterium]